MLILMTALFQHKSDEIKAVAHEIALIVDYVPIKHHLTEFDEIGLWEFFIKSIKESQLCGVPDPVIIVCGILDPTGVIFEQSLAIS